MRFINCCIRHRIFIYQYQKKVIIVYSSYKNSQAHVPCSAIIRTDNLDHVPHSTKNNIKNNQNQYSTCFSSGIKFLTFINITSALGMSLIYQYIIPIIRYLPLGEIFIRFYQKSISPGLNGLVFGPKFQILFESNWVTYSISGCMNSDVRSCCHLNMLFQFLSSHALQNSASFLRPFSFSNAQQL